MATCLVFSHAANFEAKARDAYHPKGRAYLEAQARLPEDIEVSSQRLPAPLSIPGHSVQCTGNVNQEKCACSILFMSPAQHAPCSYTT